MLYGLHVLRGCLQHWYPEPAVAPRRTWGHQMAAGLGGNPAPPPPIFTASTTLFGPQRASQHKKTEISSDGVGRHKSQSHWVPEAGRDLWSPPGAAPCRTTSKWLLNTSKVGDCTAFLAWEESGKTRFVTRFLEGSCRGEIYVLVKGSTASCSNGFVSGAKACLLLPCEARAWAQVPLSCIPSGPLFCES